jgi:DNA-directed RNA polymerase specialized sigma24 family protein
MIRILEVINQYDGRTLLSTFLYYPCRTVIYNYLRKKMHSNKVSFIDDGILNDTKCFREVREITEQDTEIPNFSTENSDKLTVYNKIKSLDSRSKQIRFNLED